MSLVYLSQQILIYVCFFLVVIGLIGNGINILIFTNVRAYKKTPCTFYFVIGSIINILFISINISSRIISTGFEIDINREFVRWCGVRQYCVITFASITLTCSCLATIDQYFVTSRNVHIRSLSNIKWAYRTILIVVSLWCVHGIPCLIFYESSSVNMCVSNNAAYAVYIIAHLLALLCAIPVLVMVTFAYLTYRNIQLTRILAQEQADRQLVRMTMFHIVLVVSAFVPYGINNIYNLIAADTIKDPNTIDIKNFATAMFNLCPYLYYTGSCYMFLMSSSRFRRAIKQRIFFCQCANQVGPNHTKD